MKKNNFFYLPDRFIKKHLADSLGAIEVDTLYLRKNFEEFQNSTFFIRGVTNHKYCKKLLEYNANFFYIDTGYFGNFNDYYKTDFNLRKKVFHRISFNKMQIDSLKKVGDERYLKTLELIKKDYSLSKDDFIKPWKKNGSNIIICPPSSKVGSVFGINIDQWIENVIIEIKKYSDRKIVIRKKPESRSERFKWNTIQAALDDDVFILVTYNSIAATEAILHGIPALTLGPNAATPISISKIENIESPIYPDRQLWLNNLCFNQFHIQEFKDGIVWDILKKYRDI